MRFILSLRVAAVLLLASCAYTGVLLVAPPVEAHRPGLQFSTQAADKAASWMCWNLLFPLDPQEQRCRTSGADLDYKTHRVCPGHGDPRGSWCFDEAWATNNNFRVYRFRLRVSYVCERGPGGLPCAEYKVYYSNIRLFNAGVGG